MIQASNFLSLSEDNNEFALFLCLGTDQNIMTNNSSLIHMESRDIFYDNFNTNEKFYSLLLTQQGESKQVIPKRISYTTALKSTLKTPSFFFYRRGQKTWSAVKQKL